MLDNVETYLCSERTQRQHVLANLDKYVVKAVGESGGYGMLIGPHSTAAQRDEFRKRIEADPRNYIAQPTLHALARALLLRRQRGAAACRPAAVHSVRRQDHDRARRIDAGGAAKGSLVVNSSQGGGSKDTWVLDQGRRGCFRASLTVSTG